ncbi:PIN-like domain-containing protein [Lentzea sp. NPDC055074]
MTDGIFDGFEDYRTPTSDDYKNTLTNGMVVFDANVLLNLYRFNSTTRADLIKVMQSLGNGLWIPHQVMREFWRNRESVIDQLGETPKESLAKLDKARQDAEEAVRAWSKRIYLPEGERNDLLTKLNGVFQTVRGTISEQAASNAHPHDTNNDAIVTALDSILADRKGSALPVEEHEAAVAEAERRIAAKEPPGYLDLDKTAPENRAGDYLVWKQVLLEAERRKCDVLLVTSDAKDDWWRRSKGQLRGPRLELMAEFRRCTGHRLFMIQPSELIRRADSLTDVHVNPKSADDIERVENVTGESVPPEVARAVVAEIYRQIADTHGTYLPSKMAHRAVTDWIADPAIGGVLSDYLSAPEIRLWIKDNPLRFHWKALDGFGPYTDLVAMRFQSPAEILDEACGPDWRVQPGTKTEIPFRCLATNGAEVRSVCWGAEAEFEQLLDAATRSRDSTTIPPMIVITQRSVPSELEYFKSVADAVGADLVYLKRELIPNPDYAG